jgi:RNA polymerase sigma factor (sigma-70 family)
LHVEALEDRTVTSTVDFQSLGPLAGTSIAPGSQNTIATISSDWTPVLNDGAKILGWSGPALERLLQDVQGIDARSPDLLSPDAAIHVRLALSSLFGDTVATFLHNQNGTYSAALPGSGAIHYQPPALEFSRPLDPDKTENLDTQPNSSGDVPRPNKNVPGTGSDANLVTGTDADESRNPQGGAPATSEVHGSLTSPTTGNRHNRSGACDLTDQADLSGITDVPVTRLRQNNTDLARSETTGTVPQARPSDRVEIPTARTSVERLPADLPDGSLLHRFVAGGEQAAFTALVHRYERLVLSTCQRVLGDSHAAQDAFQATFLVLARKANMLDTERPLAGWLYQVAYHLALRLRAVAARQRRREREATNGKSSRAVIERSADIEERELRQALIEELQRLPEKYRAPLVLCYFDGRTHSEAARAIGLPRGSMAKRIREGLQHLRARLLDRGFML